MNVKSSACIGTLLAAMLIGPGYTAADNGTLTWGRALGDTGTHDGRMVCQSVNLACASFTQAVLRAPEDVEYQTRADLVQPNQSRDSGRARPAPLPEDSQSAPQQSEVRQ